MKEKALYRVRFVDGVSTTFHLNNLGGTYYAELLTGDWIESRPKHTAVTVEFKGETHADIMEQINEFLNKARPNVPFSTE